MSEAMLIACLSFAGTILGSLLGILTANKLTQYRIEQLENTVNTFKESLDKIAALESHNLVQDEQIRNLTKIVEGMN